MSGLINIIKDGGIWTLLPLGLSALSGLALLIWIFLITKGQKKPSPLIVSIPIGLTVLSGIWGYSVGIFETLNAVANAPADMKDALTWAGTSMSLIPLVTPLLLAPIAVLGFSLLWLHNLFKNTKDALATSVNAGSWGVCLLIAMLATPLGRQLGVHDFWDPPELISSILILLCMAFLFTARSSTENEEALMRSFMNSLLCAVTISTLALAQYFWSASEAFDAMANAPAEIKMSLVARGFFSMQLTQQFFVPAAALGFGPCCYFTSQMNSSAQVQSLIAMVFVIGCFVSVYVFCAQDPLIFSEILNL
ncbi:MAG: hypothetical protein CMK59_15005 [Proteobacteria bacterium]|nr:hypothetical protein [Pseudomonadota bacterium]